jgi:predicted DNA-binding transcriptional regulator YafY
MATNKNATIRYQTLDRCFRNPGRKYYMDDLIEECNHALLDIDPDSTGVKRRQIFDDIKFMKDSLGFNAPVESFRDGKKVFYRYEGLNFSINNQPLNGQEAQQLKEALMTLSRFKGMPQFEWIEEIKARLEQSFNLKSQENIISFDENEFLKGREFIGDLYNAIINKQTLFIQYKPFKAEENIQFEIHPYHLKQFNNRWFLFGWNEMEEHITNIALDRISSISNSKTPFVPNTEIDFQEFFDDVIGVSVPYKGEPEKILLKIDIDLWPYIKTKPMHGSQKTKKIGDQYTLIELELIPNYELEALILYFGDQIELIEPKALRDKLAIRVEKLVEKYRINAV